MILFLLRQWYFPLFRDNVKEPKQHHGPRVAVTGVSLKNIVSYIRLVVAVHEFKNGFRTKRSAQIEDIFVLT